MRPRRGWGFRNTRALTATWRRLGVQGQRCHDRHLDFLHAHADTTPSQGPAGKSGLKSRPEGLAGNSGRMIRPDILSRPHQITKLINFWVHSYFVFVFRFVFVFVFLTFGGLIRFVFLTSYSYCSLVTLSNHDFTFRIRIHISN